MTTTTNSRNSSYFPSETEDNDLFVATGFRYYPALDRGFPFPWCAKKVGKGWIVRDRPPSKISKSLTNEGDMQEGVEFVGWKSARDVYDAKLAIINVRNRVVKDNPNHNNPPGNDDFNLESLASQTHMTELNCSVNRGARKMDDIAIDQWFKNTAEHLKNRRKIAQEAEFQVLLRELQKNNNKQRSRLVKSSLKMKKKQRKINLVTLQEVTSDMRLNQYQRDRSVNAAGLPETNTLQTYELHKDSLSFKRKKNVRTHSQLNMMENLFTDGEDLDLEKMMQEIFHEFQEKDNPVDFADSAVELLKDAAHEVVMNRDKSVDAILSKFSINETISKALQQSTHSVSDEVFRHEASLEHGDWIEEDLQNDTFINNMIEELLGELEHDSGYQFDGNAVKILAMASQEIIATRENECRSMESVADSLLKLRGNN